MGQLEQGFQIRESDLDFFLSPIFEEWLLCIQRYCRLKPEDAPYWHSENSNTSLLAGAAWRAGFAALTEFAIERQHAGEAELRSSWGRADLSIADENIECMIEAKQCWPQSGKLRQDVQMGLNQASDQVSLIRHHDKTSFRLAVSFCGPALKATEKNDVEALVKESVELARTFDCAASAWCFPKETREVISGNWRYPGIMIFVALVANP